MVGGNILNFVCLNQLKFVMCQREECFSTEHREQYERLNTIPYMATEMYYQCVGDHLEKFNAVP